MKFHYYSPSSRYAVFALGSSAYPNYCAFGKYVGTSIGDMGAERLGQLTWGDELAGQEQQFNAWAKEVFTIGCKIFCLDDDDDDAALRDATAAFKVEGSAKGFDVKLAPASKVAPPADGLAQAHSKKVRSVPVVASINQHGEKAKRALIETENRPCRKNNINENSDYTKKSPANGFKINISDNSSSSYTSSNSSSSNNNTNSSSNNSSSTLNGSDLSSRSSKRLTKMVAAMAAVTISTLLVFAHYNALVRGGIQLGVSSPVGNMDGTNQDTLDREAMAAAFARKHAEEIIDSVAPGNVRLPEAAGGKRTGTARNTLKANPESDRKRGLNNANIGKIPPIPIVLGADKDKKETQDSKGINRPGKKKAGSVNKKSDTSELPVKEKKLEASDMKTSGVSMEKSPQELRREEEEGDFLSETWSEDGRVHCVEESPDLIRCHTHDDVEEDENFKDREEKKSKSVKNYERPTKPRITGTPNRQTGGNATGSQSTKSSPWKGFSRDNQPDGLLLPTDKISDRKRPLVRLYMTETEPKVVNVDTGEIKPLKMLNESEDVEIDSLVSTYKPRGKGSNFTTHGTDQSLQELLTEIRERNFLELDIDYEEKLIYRLWQDDDHCHRFATRFGRNVPEVDLGAYPRSGSSWLRYLLESITGVFTGTAHASSGLHQLGFLGEVELPYTRRTLTFLSHSASANPGVERQTVQGGRDNVPAILLIRNPAAAIASHWTARNTSGLDAVNVTSSLGTFQTPEFHDFVKEELEKWEQTYSNRLLWSRSVHVLHYEDLLRRPLLELLKVLRFLQLPPPTGGRLFCLRKHIEGRLKGRRRKHDPYTTLEEDEMWSSVTRVTALLQLRGLNLPAYHTPLVEYPPDRMYKSFIKRSEENDSRKRQKDEL